ncbi:MAG: hypothetical protein NTV43_03370 [Methylococcales bacterium]|nr:hypothetical protein [Methylococcales bacterium]
MKNMLNKRLAIVLALAALGQVSSAAALPYSGALGVPAGAIDIWTVVCPATTTALDTKVIDLAPVATPLVKVQAIKGVKATNATDPKEDKVYSPLVKAASGVGIYYVFVDKTAAGAELYTVDIACKNSKNVALTATSVDLTQDN